MEPTAEQILELVAAYAAKRHRSAEFDPSEPVVPVSGKVFGPEEVVELVRSSLDFWLTSGPRRSASSAPRPPRRRAARADGQFRLVGQPAGDLDA